ncbi:MAG TPA: cytochrome c-type biogenesis CcmF C-terminal domain-containing protein [Ignavibacteriaceae bacterium]|nr:cytochrome c-type biogenesis CcmF C-terminal domain-containing protein [Ignavibacteriaceae bacterium]
MIGSIVLSIALAFSLLSMLMYFLSYRGYKNTLNYGRIAYHGMAVLVIIAATILWYIILTHQYQYHYVYSYSQNSLKTGFLIASFWGGQEGSFMLWLLLTSIVGIFLQSYTSKRGDLELRVMTVFTLATTFLLIMVSPLFKNPFAFIWAEQIFIPVKSISAGFLNMPWLQSFIFSDGQNGQNFVKMSSNLFAVLQSQGISVNQFVADGRGLNPQLLNFWMQIHPPILFTGFSMSTVPFSFAVAAMMKNDYKDWVRQSFPWVLAGAGILGLGIMLGGYWAYEMLGWGGYWAWDPVENSSLIPWLVGVASIHTLLVQRKSQAKGGIGKYAKTNLILCIMTYILVLYSTFLTRSGVLGDASVHSFVDPGMLVYLFLIIFIGSFIVLGFGMLTYRWKFLNEAIASDENLLSRDLALFTAAIVLTASAIIVFVGTSAPLFGQSVDKFFYNQMNTPIAIIIGLLNGLSLLLKWKQTKGQELIRKSIPAVASALLFTAILIIFGGMHEIMMILLAFSASFTVAVNVEIAVKIIRGNLKMLGAYVAHIGIALFILGVIGSSAYSNEKDLDLIKNQPKEAFGYKLTFTGYHPIENNTKYAFNINVEKGSKKYTVSPVMYISDFNNGLMREPAILNMLTKDIYVSPLGYDDQSQDNASEGQSVTLKVGQKTNIEGTEILYNEFVKPDFSVMQSGGDFKMGTNLTVTKDGKTYNVEPMLKKTGRDFIYLPAEIADANIKIQLKKIDPSTETADFIVGKLKDDTKVTVQTPKEILTVQASVKPFISFVWVGILIMVVGFFVAVSRRLRESLIKS